MPGRLRARAASWLSRAVARVLKEEVVERRLWEIVHAPQSGDCPASNIDAELVRRAAAQTAEYVERRMAHAPSFAQRFDLLEHALSRAGDGLVLEFGVEDGTSINFIADRVKTTVHGFDSFEGLPEPWIQGLERGALSTGGRLPEVRENVELHVGWFKDVLPGFLARRDEHVAFMHVDCDLYSSTRCVLDHLGERIVPGTVIQFDEYFNYPGWREHEFKAFQEFVRDRRLRYDYLGYVRTGYSVAVAIR